MLTRDTRVLANGTSASAPPPSFILAPVHTKLVSSNVAFELLCVHVQSCVAIAVTSEKWHNKMRPAVCQLVGRHIQRQHLDTVLGGAVLFAKVLD
jgi:hypothetical protein